MTETRTVFPMTEAEISSYQFKAAEGQMKMSDSWLDSIKRSELMGGLKNKVDKNQNLSNARKIDLAYARTIASDMYISSILNAPSMMGKKFYSNSNFPIKNSSGLIKNSLINPISAIWQLAWPSLDQIFRGGLISFFRYELHILYFTALPLVLKLHSEVWELYY